MFDRLSNIFGTNDKSNKLKKQLKDAQRQIETLNADLAARDETIKELNAKLESVNNNLQNVQQARDEAFVRLRNVVDDLSVKLYNVNEQRHQAASTKDQTIAKHQTTIKELNKKLASANDELKNQLADRDAAFARLRKVVDDLSIKLYNANENHDKTASAKNKTIADLRKQLDELNRQAATSSDLNVMMMMKDQTIARFQSTINELNAKFQIELAARDDMIDALNEKIAKLKSDKRTKSNVAAAVTTSDDHDFTRDYYVSNIGGAAIVRDDDISID